LATTGTASNAADPLAPLFFLSYARVKSSHRPVAPPASNDAHVRTFFTDLSNNVAQLVPRLPGQDPGFMDISMDTGVHWRRQLIKTAGHCQVFVALISPLYLESDWCAMEWDLFARRVVVRSTPGLPGEATAILPVHWAPTQRPVPDLIGEVQRFEPQNLPDPTFGALYQADGLFGLMQMGHPGYQTIVWKIALEIQRMEAIQRVHPSDQTTLRNLRRNFVGRVT
jgi:hypothetical protein